MFIIPQSLGQESGAAYLVFCDLKLSIIKVSAELQSSQVNCKRIHFQVHAFGCWPERLPIVHLLVGHSMEAQLTTWTLASPEQAGEQSQGEKENQQGRVTVVIT